MHIKKFSNNSLPEGVQVKILQSHSGAKLQARAKRREEVAVTNKALNELYLDLAIKFLPLRPEDRTRTTPTGYLQSITHTWPYVGAALCSSDKYNGFGIDLENLNRDISDKFIARIATPAEHDWLNESKGIKREIKYIRLFSAKEALYKSCSEQISSFSYRDLEILPTKTNTYLATVKNINLKGELRFYDFAEHFCLTIFTSHR